MDKNADSQQYDIQSLPASWFEPAAPLTNAFEAEMHKKAESYWRSIFHQFFQRRSARFFTVLMLLLVLFSIAQPFLPGQRDPSLINNDPITGLQRMNLPPCREFWLGTNKMGQDLWARLWAGTRVSLLIGFSVAMLRSFLGVLMGMLWGYVRQLDILFTEVYNVLDNIPSTIVLVVASYMLRPSIGTMVLAMCATGWIGSARFIRNQVVIIRDRDYNKASHCLGTPLHRVLVHNILPHTLAIVLLQVAQAIPAAIGNEVFLTYLGMGLPANYPSLGNLVNIGRTMIMTPSLSYQFYAPASVLSLITISFYIIGRRFSDVSDPRNHAL